MIKQAVRKCAEVIAPNWESRVSERRWLRQHAKEFKDCLDRLASVEDRVDYARSHAHLRSNQMRTEIISLLKVLGNLKPRRLCEIGADRGGTLALFGSVAAQDAKLLSIDINYPANRSAVYTSLSRATQKVCCYEADSHSPVSVAFVEAWLDDDQLDFLFIDGDHSYDGVKADYELYKQFVRPGGIIAFHDIVPDFYTRFGERTGHDVGEVPRFWSELKQEVSDWQEFIEDASQDGYGIGMIRVAGKPK